MICFSSQVAESCQRNPGIARHRTSGPASSRQPGTSFLPAFLYICCPWCGIIWSNRFVNRLLFRQNSYFETKRQKHYPLKLKTRLLYTRI